MKLYEDLLVHWNMCQAMRHQASSRMRSAGIRYFCAKKSVAPVSIVDRKALGYVTEVGSVHMGHIL